MSTTSNQHPGNQYLLEIGAEELPVSFLLSAPTELSDKVKAALNEAGLEQGSAYGEVTVYATPRRLALIISGLPEEQPPRTFKTKGPPIRVALDADGKPTPAGQGFARKLGVEFSELVQETIEGETYMVLNRTEAGRPVGTLLAEMLPELVLGLSGSHFMAWGSNTERFSRPIRWLVSLWNDTHLPVAIGPVTSGTISQGHRVLSVGPVPIPSAAQYLETLEKEGFVLADQARRRDLIWRQLQEAAKKAGGDVLPNEDLLDTVTMLVEHPSIVTGSFQQIFLGLPEQLITTVMASHQKYFPIHKNPKELLPYFMTVSNGRQDSADTIRHGNEKVLIARFEDARFFYDEDRKIPLEDRVEKLKGITFQKGLGSMYDKTCRLERLAPKVLQSMTLEDLNNVSKHEDWARQAAHLCKTDLTTNLVFEFPELQGIIGHRYALTGNQRFPAAVSEAIKWHYAPRSAKDSANMPHPVSAALGIADKLDTMVAVFSQKGAKLPSGSKDPLGLRRMAMGIISIICENSRHTLDLIQLIRDSYQILVENLPPKEQSVKEKRPQFQDEATTRELVSTFVLQRFRGLLLEQGNRYDIVDAVLEAGRNPLSDLRDVLTRLDCLKTLTADESALKIVYEPANRIYKILGEQAKPDATTADVQAALLKDPTEQALCEEIRNLEAQGLLSGEGTAGRYTALVSALTAMSPAIEQFFDKVMVNDPDPAVRENRYNLLSVLNRHYLQLACFPKLVV